MRKAFRLPLAALFFSVLAIQGPSFAYQTDSTNHIITVSPSSSASQNTTELRNAVNVLVNRPDKSTHWTMKLNPGKYVLSAQISLQGLQNTSLTSASLTQPAQIIKMSGWDSASSAEYLMSFRLCKNVDLIGMEFYGQTSFANGPNPYWPDQGVYFGSCNTVKVDQNKFYNFGNGALRVNTWEHDPVTGVNSFNTMVSNNLFNNIYQTSTTVADTTHGGTKSMTMQNNTFVNLRGSVKFASQMPGGSDIHFINNTINGGDRFGLEINNYDNFEIRGNTIQNLKNTAINIYTEQDVQKGFAWGSNFTIAGNTIKNVLRGIRYSHEPAPTGFQSVPSNLVINGNNIDTVTTTESWVPTLWETNGVVNGVKITNNKLSNIANKKYIGIQQGSSVVSILTNTVNGVPCGPQ